MLIENIENRDMCGHIQYMGKHKAGHETAQMRSMGILCFQMNILGISNIEIRLNKHDHFMLEIEPHERERETK